MRRARLAHLYLGCILTPTLIFFCVTGGLQAFGWHRTYKNGSYTAPAWLHRASDAHMQTPFAKVRQSPPFRWWMALTAVGTTVTSLLGILMALQYVARRREVWLCLVAGVVVPILVLVAGSPAFFRH